MTSSPTRSATRYLITFLICDEQDEYPDSCIGEWRRQPTEEQAAKFTIREYFHFDSEDECNALNEYKESGCITLPNDGRVLKEFAVQLAPDAIIEQLLQCTYYLLRVCKDRIAIEEETGGDPEVIQHYKLLRGDARRAIRSAKKSGSVSQTSVDRLCYHF